MDVRTVIATKLLKKSPTLMRLSLRINASFSATFCSGVLGPRDVEQAYMQSPPLEGDVFTLPPPEAKLPPDHVLKIQLPHYGLVE